MGRWSLQRCVDASDTYDELSESGLFLCIGWSGHFDHAIADCTRICGSVAIRMLPPMTWRFWGSL